MIDNSAGKRIGWDVSGAVGVVMGLLAMVAGGCGGGGSSAIAPVAGVWVANSAATGGVPRVQHYTGLDFRSMGTFAYPPSPLLTSPFVAPQDTLFDASGNLWVVDGGNGTGTGAAIYKFLYSQVANLNTTSNPTPNFIITSPSFKFPQFAALDGFGNLYVSDSAVPAIFYFSAAQLASASGIGLTPAATLISPDFNGTLGIAFDKSGNLWIDNNGGTTIVELTGLQIAAAAAKGGVNVLAANTTLVGSTPPGGLPTINNPWGIFFDLSGDLWITNEQNTPPPVGCAGSIVEFAAGTIIGPGVLTPAANVTITPAVMGTTSSLCDPNGITVNGAGDIVVANAVGNSLAYYTASQITSSGALTPQTFIVGAATLLNAPTGLIFGPLSLQ